MDIIDIMLAKAMTPQGKTDTYVAKANKAAAKAAKAEQDAATAIATVDAAADEIATAREEAAALLEEAQDALETAQAAQINMPEAYGSTGQNTDGYMTQKATTDALATKADASTLNNYATTIAMNTALASKADTSALAAKADKTYVDQQIANIPAGGGSSGGGNTNLGSENAGNMVVVGDTGYIKPSDVSEEDLIRALVGQGTYIAKNAVGLEIDYVNKVATRTQEATQFTAGIDFNDYSMYGGRMRCNVADDGTITAFYGDDNYKDDGSNGQVMIYQPKFYYYRLPLAVDNLSKGQVIRHESIIISATKQSSFKLAPIFRDTQGNELDYVLFSAYEGTIDENDKLTSIAATKPTGNKTIAEMETAATARGTGWHIMNMAAESANQMLEIIEFGSMNGQASLDSGICNTSSNVDINCSSLTGSTATLGNISGYAASSTSEANGITTDYNDAGRRAISYRGMENPWGNMWKMIGGINIMGDGLSRGGAPYICTDFNYTPDIISKNYEEVGITLPSNGGWISGMGIGNIKYDWVFLPVECSNTANSVLPVGDNLWVTSKTTENKILAIGGSYNLQEHDGPFYYAADRSFAESARPNYGARLMFIPTINNIYNENKAKWQVKMGG